MAMYLTRISISTKTYRHRRLLKLNAYLLARTQRYILPDVGDSAAYQGIRGEHLAAALQVANPKVILGLDCCENLGDYCKVIPINHIR